MADRRTQIADAGVRILANRGARALTHLNVDRELGLPDGSTSYYARTRRELIALIIERLSIRTSDELAAVQATGPLTRRDVASMFVAGLDATMERVGEHRARLVLLLECQNDPELSETLAGRPQLLGSANPEAHARDLVGLVDALLMQRIIRTAAIDEHAIITAYLEGALGPSPESS